MVGLMNYYGAMVGREVSRFLLSEIFFCGYFRVHEPVFSFITPNRASPKMPDDILLVLYLLLDLAEFLELLVMGTSSTLNPHFAAVNFISIWNA